MEENKPFIAPPCNECIEKVYEDSNIIVIDKPAGLLSVPGKDPQNNDSVYSRLVQEFPEIHITHRLDRVTSGLMVVTKNKNALRHLNTQFEKRETKKTYTALTHGIMQETNGFIELPIICDWPNRPRQKIDLLNGRHAQTYYEVLAVKNKITRVCLTPITGRSHQLRVHMQWIKHPIVGDHFYALNNTPAKRLMLHATTLQFTHPITQKEISFSSSVPF